MITAYLLLPYFKNWFSLDFAHSLNYLKMTENKKRPREILVDQSVSTIKFGDKFDSKDMRLFEVSDDILSIVLKGKGLRILGENNDRAVLCTTETTFSIKKVETSNLMFLIPSSDVKSEFTIDTNCKHYYEVRFLLYSTLLS